MSFANISKIDAVKFANQVSATLTVNSFFGPNKTPDFICKYNLFQYLKKH